MNEAYRDGMGAAVDRLEAEQDDVTGVVVTSAKKTFFAGGNLKRMVAGRPRRRARGVRRGRGHQGRAAPARDPRPPGRRRDQRRRARRRPGDRAGLPPPHRARRPAHRDRPARGHPRPAARRRRRHPRRPDARPDRRADGRAAHRHPLQAGRRRWRRASSTSWSPHRDELVPAAKAWILAHRDDEDGRRPALGPAGYRMPGGTPSTPSWPRSCRPSRPTCASRPRARTTRRRARSCPRRSRARRSTSRPRARIESRYLTQLVVGQNSKNMIQAFFFDLQAINSGSLRPAGVRAVHRHQARACWAPG